MTGTEWRAALSGMLAAFALLAATMLAGCTTGTAVGINAGQLQAPDVKDVSFDEALKTLEMTQWVHDLSKAEIERAVQGKGIYETPWIKESALAYGRILYLRERTNGKQYLAFRGTQDAFDVVRDGVALSKFSKPLRMDFHQGFLDAAAAAHALDELRLDKGHDLVLVGHSMGGAIAGIFARYLVQQDGFSADRLQIYTFGAPYYAVCPCSELGVKSYWRFVNSKDPVPMIPQAGGVGPYRHVAPAVYLWRNGAWSFAPLKDAPWEELQANRVFETDLQLHLTDAYKQSLQGLDRTAPSVPYSTKRWRQE